MGLQPVVFLQLNLILTLKFFLLTKILIKVCGLVVKQDLKYQTEQAQESSPIFLPVPQNWAEEKSTADFVDTSSNPFAIGREGYFDEAKTIHFDDFCYRSPLNPIAIFNLRHVHHILMTALIGRIVISILSLETEI